jgi:hypothetical protein
VAIQSGIGSATARPARPQVTGDHDHVEGVAEGVVVGRLVGEPAPLSVDHHAVRPGALGVDLPRLDAAALDRHVHGGHPPGLAHVPQGGADAHRHAQPVAGVGRHADRALQRAPEEGAHEVGIALEAAGGEDDTAAGARLERAVRAPDTHAHHRAVLDQQPLPAAAGPRDDAAIEQPAEQPADQRLTAGALVAHPRRTSSSAGTPSGARRPSEVSLIAISPVSW